MSPEKPNAGKPIQLSEGFIIKQFQNTIWVPKMAHPTENTLGGSTSQSEIDINPNLPHEISQRQPLGSALAPLAQRQPIFPSISLSGLCINLWSLCVAHADPPQALRSSWLPLRQPLQALRCLSGTISAFLLCILGLMPNCPSL